MVMYPWASPFLGSIPCKRCHNFYAIKFHYFYVSVCWNSTNICPSKEISVTEKAQVKSPQRTTDISSLYRLIADLLGSENYHGDGNLHEGSKNGATFVPHPLPEHNHASMPSVCGIIRGSAQIVEVEASKCDTHVSEKDMLASAIEEDDSEVVQKITEIIRGPVTSTVQTEHKLESSGLKFDPDVVEKVLKRCFKVAHLGFHFFNWVRNQPGFTHTTKTYNVMIYISGEAKDFNLVKKLIEKMEEESCPKDIKTWSILLLHYGKAKMISETLLVFDNMKKSGFEPDERAYRSIIRSLCDSGKAEVAREFYKEMLSRNMVVDIKTYKRLLKCISSSGDMSTVRLIGADMMTVAQIPEHEVYSCLLRSFCISGRIKEALLLVCEIKRKNLHVDPENFEILMKGLCKNGQVSNALELINILKSTGIINGKIYGLISSGCMKVGDEFMAFEMLRSMQGLGYFPPASTYTLMIQHLFKKNNYKKACELYEEMLKYSEADIVAITAMAAGHVQHGYVSKAWEAFDSMRKKGIKRTPKAYSVFLRELCKAGRSDDSIKVLDEMVQCNINPGAKIFQLVISLLEKKGDWEKVDEVRNMVMRFKLIDQEASTSIGCHEKHDNPCVGKQKSAEMSNSSTEDLRSDHTTVHLLEPLNKGCSEQDFQEAFKILSCSKDWDRIQEALEKSMIQFTSELSAAILRSCQVTGQIALKFFKWVEAQPGYTHTAETYNMAIKIAGIGKDFKHMRSLYYEMRRKQLAVTANTWTIMIAQYGRVGLTQIALKTFRDMKVEGCKPNGSTYKFLITFLCERKGRKVDDAIKIFQEMIGVGYLPDKEMVAAYLSCLCEVGKLVDARKSVESLSKRGFSTQGGYSMLIKALSRSGKLEEALVLEDELTTLGCRADQYIYGSLIHGLLRGGRVNEAFKKVETMKKMGLVPTAHIYTSLMVHFWMDRKIEKALQIFEEMKICGVLPTIITYSTMIRGYMKEGKVSEAWSIFYRMKKECLYPDFKTYSMFIQCLCQIRRSEEGLHLLCEMLEGGIMPSTVNFRTVFHGLNREGKPNLAHTVLQKKWALARQRKLVA